MMRKGGWLFLYHTNNHDDRVDMKSELIINACQNGHMSIYFDMKSSETYTESERRKKNKPPPPRRHCCSCRHQYARLVHESVRRTFQTICNFGMKCASVCLSHTTQEKRQPAYHDLCMVTSRLLQCRAIIRSVDAAIIIIIFVKNNFHIYYLYFMFSYVEK